MLNPLILEKMKKEEFSEMVENSINGVVMNALQSKETYDDCNSEFELVSNVADLIESTADDMEKDFPVEYKLYADAVVLAKYNALQGLVHSLNFAGMLVETMKKLDKVLGISDNE